MESFIPCELNGSRDSLLSSTDSQQAVDYRDFCYTAPNLRNGDALVDDVWFVFSLLTMGGARLAAEM